MQELRAETFPLESRQLIEASAGTGKTWTITSLYLRLLLGHGRDSPLAVDQILVLTFTIAATEELRHRIRTRIVAARLAFLTGHSTDDFLQYLVDTSPDRNRDLRLLSAAIQLMDEATIFTIHGFCAKVLADRSMEAGVLFELDMDADREALLQTAAEDTFRTRILTLEEPLRTLALATWPHPARLLDQARSFVYRHGLEILPGSGRFLQDLAALQDRIEAARKMWIEDGLEDLLRNAGFKKNTNTFKKIGEMTEFCTDTQVADPWSSLWEHWCREKLSANIRKDEEIPSHPCLDLIDAIYESSRITREAAMSWLWKTVLEEMTRHLNTMKSSLNQLTVDDLLTRVHDALARNPQLASSLADTWPCVMVDEFQDTDDIQYDIFRTIFNHGSGQNLILIGDPKQAIYQFRGADVYTYINARKEVSSTLFSLDTNWRSTASLVAAVNHLFDQPDLFDRNIPFIPVTSSPESVSMSFRINGKEQKPVSLFVATGENGVLKAGESRQLTAEYVAEKIVSILNGATRGEVTIDGNPPKAGQIAVLVRTREQAELARQALLRRHVASVLVTQDSIFTCSTASDLLLLLKAVVEPENLHRIKSALATRLIQSTISELDAIGEDVMQMQRVVDEFTQYQQCWASRGIASMLDFMMIRRELPQKWLGRSEGERELTNLRHLAELLQARSHTSTGMHQMVTWLQREITHAGRTMDENRQIRLESDENLVKVVTMHAAKGLEYDIVFIPVATFSPTWNRKEPALFHQECDGCFHPFLETGSNDEHRRLSREEQLAEDMRLLYVAITRAKYQCHIGIPVVTDLPATALARLLRITEVRADPTEIQSGLSTLPEEWFELEMVEDCSTTPLLTDMDSRRLKAPPPAPVLSDHWRVHSYTGITRILEAPDRTADIESISGFHDDDRPDGGGATDRSISRTGFPRGPGAGVALHALLERLDFTGSPDETRMRCLHCLTELGLDTGIWLDTLVSWVEDIVHTPLLTTADVRLADIPLDHRLDELEFHFPLDAHPGFVSLLKQAGYLKKSGNDPVAPLQGLMTGAIDLVFRHEGKFYIVDYKSNFLGNTPEDYGRNQLTAAMEDHRYDLQYLIYTVALHKYLSLRLTGYDYDQHFGGVLYLFLRGMNGADSSGIYTDLPDKDLIERFASAIGEDP